MCHHDCKRDAYVHIHVCGKRCDCGIFYTRLGNVVSTVYLLPKDVATLVVEKARSDDLDEYDEPGKIDEFAEFANEIINTIQ